MESSTNIDNLPSDLMSNTLSQSENIQINNPLGQQISSRENDIKSLSSFTKRRETLDFAGFLALNKEEEPIFNFGKFKGKRIKDVLEQEPGYFGWMLNADFPKYTQKVLTQIKLGTWKL